MPDDAGCKIFVVRGDPASLISNAGVNTVFSRWWHGQWRFLYGWTRYLPVHPRKDPGPCRRDHGAYGLSRSLPVLIRLIHGRTWMSTNKQDLSLLRWYPWSSVTGRVLSGINPWTIRIHPCSSIENTRTRMAQVLTRSLRWLHGTSWFIHGTNTVDFRPGRSGEKIKHV
jgi:hypothetical protein